MQKTILLFCLLVVLFACSRKPYAEHKITLEKKADNCSGQQPSFRLNSNFGGERYEFEKCLPAGFDKSTVTSERHGDTVVVRFPTTTGLSASALFQVTLDIDSYPRYTFITIDEDTYAVMPSDK